MQINQTWPLLLALLVPLCDKTVDVLFYKKNIVSFHWTKNYLFTKLCSNIFFSKEFLFLFVASKTIWSDT